MAAEGMPDGRQVDGLVLLSASISAGYDLTKALGRCKKGILNVYNRDDGGLLGVGTTVVGTVDGSRGASAGLTGFDGPGSAAGQDVYHKLQQLEITPSMTWGDSDPHGAATRPSFVSSYVAPWILSDPGFASRATAMRQRLTLRQSPKRQEQSAPAPAPKAAAVTKIEAKTPAPASAGPTTAPAETSQKVTDVPVEPDEAPREGGVVESSRTDPPEVERRVWRPSSASSAKLPSG